MPKPETQHLKEIFLETYTQGYRQGEQDAFQLLVNAFEKTEQYKHIALAIKQIQQAALDKPLNFHVND